jgi:hypothetical protein
VIWLFSKIEAAVSARHETMPWQKSYVQVNSHRFAEELQPKLTKNGIGQEISAQGTV